MAGGNVNEQQKMAMLKSLAEMYILHPEFIEIGTGYGYVTIRCPVNRDEVCVHYTAWSLARWQAERKFCVPSKRS